MVKSFLFDPSNPTGFAQVLEEYVDGVLDQVFSLGHDVIAQADVSDPQDPDAYTLVSDGHGSTRALLNTLGVILEQYAYSAYGEMLDGANLTAASAALTSLLYSGEWTQANGQQYLRARFYDPASGTFNRLDPFIGNRADPQSLHKYLYAHANPVVFIDPSGERSVLGTPILVGITASLVANTAIMLFEFAGGKDFTYHEVLSRMLWAAIAGAAAGAGGFAGASIATSLGAGTILASIIGGASAAGSAQVTNEIYRWVILDEPVVLKDSAGRVLVASFVGAVTGGILARFSNPFTTGSPQGLQLQGIPNGPLGAQAVVIRYTDAATFSALGSPLGKILADVVDNLLQGQSVDAVDDANLREEGLQQP